MEPNKIFEMIIQINIGLIGLSIPIFFAMYLFFKEKRIETQEEIETLEKKLENEIELKFPRKKINEVSLEDFIESTKKHNSIYIDEDFNNEDFPFIFNRQPSHEEIIESSRKFMSFAFSHLASYPFIVKKDCKITINRLNDLNNSIRQFEIFNSDDFEGIKRTKHILKERDLISKGQKIDFNYTDMFESICKDLLEIREKYTTNLILLLEKKNRIEKEEAKFSSRKIKFFLCYEFFIGLVIPVLLLQTFPLKLFFLNQTDLSIALGYINLFTSLLPYAVILGIFSRASPVSTHE